MFYILQEAYVSIKAIHEPSFALIVVEDLEVMHSVGKTPLRLPEQSFVSSYLDRVSVVHVLDRARWVNSNRAWSVR